MRDGGRGQVVVGVRRGLLERVGEVLLGCCCVGMMMRGVEWHMGEGVSDCRLGGDGADGRAEAQRG